MNAGFLFPHLRNLSCPWLSICYQVLLRFRICLLRYLLWVLLRFLFCLLHYLLWVLLRFLQGRTMRA